MNLPTQNETMNVTLLRLVSTFLVYHNDEKVMTI